MGFIKVVLGIAMILGIIGTIAEDNKGAYTLLFIAGAILYLVCLKMGG